MRFLADAGISPKTVEFLNQLGHEATHVRELGMQRATDREIIDRARLENQSKALASGALVLVESARYRIRNLPILR